MTKFRTLVSAVLTRPRSYFRSFFNSSPREPDTSPAFLAYGRVMAKIAACEEFMRIAIGEHEALTDQNPVLVDTDQRKKFVGKVMKWDFGSLTQQMCDRYPDSAELRSLMKDAKNMRNYLAHEFWAGHFGNLHSHRGIEIVVAECELRELHFERISEFFIAKTGINTASYVQFVAANGQDEVRLKQWEELIVAARSFEAERLKHH